MNIEATYTPPPQQQGHVTLTMPLEVAIAIRALLGACNGDNPTRRKVFAALDRVVCDALDTDRAPELRHKASGLYVIDLSNALEIK